MVAKVLKDILTRVESWPEREQEEAAASLQAIEKELREPYELTEDDKKAINCGLEAVRKGEIATDQEVEAASPNTVKHEGQVHQARAGGA